MPLQLLVSAGASAAAAAAFAAAAASAAAVSAGDGGGGAAAGGCCCWCGCCCCWCGCCCCTRPCRFCCCCCACSCPCRHPSARLLLSHHLKPRDGEFEVGAVCMVSSTAVFAKARDERALKLVHKRVVLTWPGAEAVKRVRALGGLPFSHNIGYLWVLALVRINQARSKKHANGTLRWHPTCPRGRVQPTDVACSA